MICKFITSEKILNLSLSILFVLLCLFLKGQKHKVTFVSFGSTKIDVSSIKSEVEEISTGLHHCNFLDKNGVFSTFVDSSISQINPPLLTFPLTSASTGDIHTLVLLPDSSIFQFFATEKYNMFYPHRLKNIKWTYSGPLLSSALSYDSVLYTWGNGNVINEYKIFPKVYGVSDATLGKNFMAFIHRSGNVIVSGENRYRIKQVPNFTGNPIKIVAGEYHILVLDDRGKVYSWGRNDKSQCDLPKNLPGVKSIYAKGNLSAVLDSTNTIHVFGEDIYKKIELKNTSVSAIGLGRDYLVISSFYKKKSMFKSKKSHLYPLAGTSYIDFSSSFEESQKSSQNKYDEIVQKNFGRNILNASRSSLQNKNESTEVQFKGENNTVTFINEGISKNSSKGYDRVIFKGNNNNIVVHSYGQNNTSVIGDRSGTIEIDLDKIGSGNRKQESIYYQQDSEDFRDKMANATSVSQITKNFYKNSFESSNKPTPRLYKVLKEYGQMKKGFWIDSLPSEVIIRPFPVEGDNYYVEGIPYSLENEGDIEWALETKELGGFESGRYFLFKNDTSMAIRKFRLGATMGDAESFLALQQIYQEGIGVTRDMNKASHYKKEYDAFLKEEREHLVLLMESYRKQLLRAGML